MGPGGHGCAGTRVFCPGHAHADMEVHVLNPAGLLEMMRCLQVRLNMHST